jgi:hypothetical protein
MLLLSTIGKMEISSYQVGNLCINTQIASLSAVKLCSNRSQQIWQFGDENHDNYNKSRITDCCYRKDSAENESG